MIRYLCTLSLAIASAFISTHASAEKVVVYREGQLVSPRVVAAVLGKTRGLALLDDEAPRPMVVARADAPKPDAPKPDAPKADAPKPAPAPAARDDARDEPSALSLPVHFAFDSAEILPAARTQLDALAEGIKMLAPTQLVTVEGHTDATGSDAYNLELSRHRARAVRDYLVQRHSIDGARLKTVGYGEGRPIDAADPHAALNRRVQFRGS